MTGDRWQQVNALFHAALERDAAGRDALLRQEATRDPELAAEVRSLLARHQSTEGFLEAPAWEVAADLIVDGETSLVGRRIGSYEVLREIGRGGMGVVYAARDERLGRTVALKALPPEFTRNRRHRDRLAREARAAAAFTHDAIATVFALEEIDGELFIASELVEGETLRDELARGPIGPERLLPTLIEIVNGLSAAHARGIVHRDLKPENIIRRTDGHIKILDFGLARIISPGLTTMTRLTEPGVAPGTPGYMAPEQLSGADTDPRTDLFAFGVLAWELASGEHPFGSNPAVMLARMMEGRPLSHPRQLSFPALDPVIRRCLRVAMDERYPSADALLADLRRLAGSAGQPLLPAVEPPALWWWRFHQLMMAAVDACTPILAGLAGRSFERRIGVWIFFAALALATAAVTLRLNLVFTARVDPARLGAHRAHHFRWIAAAESLLSILILSAGVAAIEPSPIIAGVLVCLAIVMLASLAVIEPATTASAGLDAASSPLTDSNYKR